jgi:two-component system, OmpR family, sensor histidine kinase VicK
MNMVDELRHLDGVKGGMAVSESEYMATTVLEESKPLIGVIYSNVKEVVEQGQYIFDTLWRSSASAEQKIREIDEGILPDFIQTITDSYTVQKLGFELTSSAKHEILAIFSTVNPFHRQERVGAIKPLNDMAERRDIKVRILSPEDERIKAFVENVRKQQEEKKNNNNTK